MATKSQNNKYDAMQNKNTYIQTEGVGKKIRNFIEISKQDSITIQISSHHKVPLLRLIYLLCAFEGGVKDHINLYKQIKKGLVTEINTCIDIEDKPDKLQRIIGFKKQALITFYCKRS